MLRTIISLLGLMYATQALAQMRIAYRQPSASTMAEVREDDEVVSDSARVANKARHDAFDRRIAENSNRAVRSICSSCSKTATLIASRSAGPDGVRARLNSDGIPLDDPDSAPTE